MDIVNLLQAFTRRTAQEDEERNKRKIKVAIGSTSWLKKKAVERAFPNTTVVNVECQSAVPPQPVGKEQTTQGARNRCDKAQLKNYNNIFIPLKLTCN